MSSTSLVFKTLKNNIEFKEVLSSKKIDSQYFTIFCKKISNLENQNIINLSCVAPKKLGTAVRRNRIKRRLKMAVRHAIKDLSSNFNHDYKYAIFGKSKMFTEKFLVIVEELKKKLNF
jgi:ribonuclease P protein component